MLIPSSFSHDVPFMTSLSRRVNANSQQLLNMIRNESKLIKKGEC